MYDSLNILHVHRSKESCTEIISPGSYANVDTLMTELMSLEWFYQIIWVLKAVDFLYKYPTLQSELKWQHRRSTYFAFIWISCFSLQTSIVQNILEGIVCITRKTTIVALRFRTVHQVLHTQRRELAYFPGLPVLLWHQSQKMPSKNCNCPE